MKKKTLKIGWIFIIFLFVLTSCAPRYNTKADQPIPPSTPSNIQQDDQALIFAALSGGGTRAAAMSWKTLELLKRIPYTYRDNSGTEITSTLADEIDCISGISGGSFAAAAWCFYGDNLDLFRKRFIERNIQGELAKGLLIPPWQGVRLISPYYDRINLASELYDETVFDHKTFGDLSPHPMLWIHATHLALGDRFTFNQSFFDYLDSDISKYPIGYACAASSAFPILLSPMTLLNFGDPVSLDKDIKYTMAQKNARDDIEQYYYCRMREFYNDKKTNKFMHIADGGLVDNQGLQAIIDQFETNGIINKKLNDKENPLRRLIIINVNAGVSEDDPSCESKNDPGVTSVIEYTMVTSMDILSAKRWKQIKEKCTEIYQAVIDIGDSTKSLSLLEKPYTIEISFRNLKDDALRKACNRLPTSFHLDKNQLELIDKVVPSLVEEDPDMIRLKESLKLPR